MRITPAKTAALALMLCTTVFSATASGIIETDSFREISDQCSRHFKHALEITVE